ncbi:hypothetical protein H0G86_004828 [Trichoderma simmonsii]|uniref:Uncharacterized protein n=1 Tax=Trichoderma simmonsii TaxID=1491479 RepID=A0A8G0LAE4_9HYPO|nr:hypothetical protein H0G86_004828 [Trichoderma simmonsii]
MLIINQMGWSPSLGKDDGRIGGYSAELAEMELVPIVMQWCIPNLEAEIQAPHMYQTNTEYSYASLVDDATISEDGKSSTWSKAVCRALFSNLAQVLRTQLHMLGLVGEPP